MAHRRLTWLLRHGGIDEGFEFDAEGYTSASQVLDYLQVNRAELEQIVKADSKTRFTLQGDRIRANQGHSHSIGTQIDPTTYLRYDLCDLSAQTLMIHGTYQHWLSSIQTQGLSRMSRTMIHMCQIELEYPAFEPVEFETEPVEFETIHRLISKVHSGVRRNCNLYIIIDHISALRDGIKFYRSSNGVILSDGVNGIIPPKYLRFITR